MTYGNSKLCKHNRLPEQCSSCIIEGIESIADELKNDDGTLTRRYLVKELSKFYAEAYNSEYHSGVCYKTKTPDHFRWEAEVAADFFLQRNFYL